MFSIGAVFTLLLAAGTPGFQGEVSECFDPAAAPKIKMQLDALPSDPTVERIIGKVVDLVGEPIVGAEVRSHNILGDTPIAGVEIGLVQKNRMMGATVTPYEVFTDETGAFAFDLLPPGLDDAIYTPTDQDASAVLQVKFIQAPEHGQIADLGEIQAQHPRRLTSTESNVVFRVSPAGR